MSNSKKLRKTIVDNKINNPRSQKVEKDVIIATINAIEKLQQKYPNYKIFREEELKKIEIHNKLKDLFLKDPFIGSNITNNESGIKPDGGFIYVISPKGNKLLLGSIEAKNQGTNDIREAEGKSKQARGNAIERSCKNDIEIDNYFLSEDIFPYIIFMRGCDLEDINSSIRDRITGMNLGSEFNKLYVNKIKDKFGKLYSRTSLFIGIKSIDKMSEIILEMLEISIKYYINKYTEDFNETK